MFEEGIYIFKFDLYLPFHVSLCMLVTFLKDLCLIDVHG